jgi:hypothetical protein
LTYDVSGNSLDGEVPDMCGAPGITYLFLHKNKLTGALPDLSCMTGLYEVNVSENGLTSLAGDWLGGSPKLQHFNAERNQLTGAPPSSLCGTLSKTLYPRAQRLARERTREHRRLSRAGGFGPHRGRGVG